MLEVVYQWTGWLTSRWGIVLCTIFAVMNAGFGRTDAAAGILAFAVLGLVIRSERNQALLKAEIVVLRAQLKAASPSPVPN